MSDKATEHTVVDAPVDACFDALIDFERYPEWAGDLKQAVVLERDEHGRGLVVEFRAAGMGRSTTYRLRYDYDGAPNRLGWVLESGDLQRELDGAYHLRPDAHDPSRTDVLYELTVDLVIPIPGFVKRRAEARIMKTALPDFKAMVEARHTDG